MQGACSVACFCSQHPVFAPGFHTFLVTFVQDTGNTAFICECIGITLNLKITHCFHFQTPFSCRVIHSSPQITSLALRSEVEG